MRLENRSSNKRNFYGLVKIYASGVVGIIGNMNSHCKQFLIIEDTKMFLTGEVINLKVEPNMVMFLLLSIFLGLEKDMKILFYKGNRNSLDT